MNDRHIDIYRERLQIMQGLCEEKDARIRLLESKLAEQRADSDHLIDMYQQRLIRMQEAMESKEEDDHK